MRFSRRILGMAKADFWSGWIVSFIAIALYIGQAIAQVQLADLLQYSVRFRSFAEGLLMGMGIVTGYYAAMILTPARIRSTWRRLAMHLRTLLASAGLVLFMRLYIFSLPWKGTAYTRYTVLGVATTTFGAFLLQRVATFVKHKLTQEVLNVAKEPSAS